METYDKKCEKIGDEVWTSLMRRLILQVTDSFWLENLETMEYLRRSVSLRAYGQRDPLIEYRREGLTRFKAMEASIEDSIRTVIPRIERKDEERIKAEEDKTRRAVLAASEAGKKDGQGTMVSTSAPGRNDLVKITNGTETKEMKYKKAEPLLAEGWIIVS
jgi:preprotein translocase subunit SecA